MKKQKPVRLEKTFPQFVAAFLINDFSGVLAKYDLTFEDAQKLFPADILNQFLQLLHGGFLERSQLRRICHLVFSKGQMLDRDEAVVDLICAWKLAYMSE